MSRWRRFLGTGIALCTLQSVLWAQLQPNAPWPSLGRDYQNTRCTTLGAPTNGSVRWIYNAGSRTFASPAVAADGTIYVPCAAGVDAVNPNGTRRWRWSAGIGVPFSTPAIGVDGTIYVIGNPNDALLIALNPNGTLRWSLYLGGTEVRSSPAIGPDGRIYVTNGQSPGGYLYCVNPDGTVAWRVYLGWEANSTPCFGNDGTIYVGASNQLYAIRPDGTILWRFPVFYPITGAIALGSNRLFFGSWDYAFRAVNLSGQLLWRYLTFGIIDTGPAVAPDAVYFGSRDLYLYKFSHNGVLRWRASIGTRGSTPAIGADGTVYVLGWQLYAVNPANGLIRWSFYPALPNHRSAMAIGADGTVYYLDATGQLYAFGPLSGFLMGDTELEGWNGSYAGLEAVVQFYQDGELKYEMVAPLDADGNFSLSETPVGEHDIKIRLRHSLPGVVRNVHIETDSPGYVRVVLGNGDLNADGVVDDEDLLTILMAYDTINPELDLTGDGYVDDADLLIVLFNFGSRGEGE
ncbi:MAG: PQQ-binding-like beta-propeller repeat protein [Armatimonadota bacterium]